MDDFHVVCICVDVLPVSDDFIRSQLSRVKSRWSCSMGRACVFGAVERALVCCGGSYLFRDGDNRFILNALPPVFINKRIRFCAALNQERFHFLFG